MNSSTGSKLDTLCHLLTTLPLTPTEQTELKNLINNPALPDKQDPVLEVIENWLSHGKTPTRQALLATYIRETEGPESRYFMGPGGINVTRGPGGITPPHPNRTAKELLNNALLVNPTPPPTATPPQDPSREQS